MAFSPFDHRAIGVAWKGERTQRHALIDLDVIADLGGFTDDHTGPVIDKKPVTDGGAGMNIDAGPQMCPFGHHARHQGHLQPMNLMTDSMDGHRIDERVTKNDLLHAAGSGIAVIAGHHIAAQAVTDLRQTGQQRGGVLFRQLQAALLIALLGATLRLQGTAKNVDAAQQQRIHGALDVKEHMSMPGHSLAVKTGEQKLHEIIQQANDGALVRQILFVHSIDAAMPLIAGD